MDRSRLNMRLAFVLVLAFGLRVAAALTLQSVLDHQGRLYLIPGDAEGYWHLAEDIVAGRDYSIYTPPRQVLRTPGFPAILAAPIALFGNSQLPVRIVLAAIGTLGCAAVYWLGRTLFDRQTGLAAAAIAAVLPTFVGFSPLILSETAFAAGLTASLAAAAMLVRCFRRDEICKAWFWLAVMTGVLIGVANYVRPSWLLAAPMIAGLTILAGKRQWRAWAAGLSIGIAVLLALLPWALRNQRVTGHFVLTTLWMGPSLYDGWNPEATGDSDMAFFDRENKLGEMTEYEMNHHYRDRAWTFAKEHPWRAIQLAFIKLGRFWKPWPNADQFSNWGSRLAVFLSFVVLFSLAVVGLWRTRPSPYAIALTVGPILYFSAVHAVFVGSLRYRLPAEYPLAVLAGPGWCSLRGGTASHPAPGDSTTS